MHPLHICVLQFSLILLSCIFLAEAGTVHNPDNIFLNCGSSGISTAFSGQKWIGDVDLETPLVSRWTKRRLINSSPIDKLLTSDDPVPYATAQLSRDEFVYAFQVSPGPKFIRLHFYPASYPGFQRYASLFTVKAGPYTLLSNYSASLTADDLGLKVIKKEFLINIAQPGQRPLHISFSPSNTSSSSYAFVNGIEVVSMPTGLYYTPMGDDAGVEVVGQKYGFVVGENTAMELVKRLNVGGSSISSMHDPGLFREWSDDTAHLQGSGFSPISTTARINYKDLSTFIAPQSVYQTSWSVDPGKMVSSNFTWRLLVDSGFKYLVRLHFCELHYEIMDYGKREFSLIINDQIAESNRDLIKWAGEIGVAVYKDYVIEMKGYEREGKRDLLVSICSHQNPEMDEPVDAILKALELFKLSNPDNNLAGVNPVVSSQHLNPHKSLFIPIVGQGIVTIIVTLVTALVVIVYAIRVWSEKIGKENDSSPQLGVSCRCFSLKELRSATNNFEERLVIGRGGFGKVYKGRISMDVGVGAEFVAIKRRNKTSEQGETEFLKEIEMLSNFKDAYLVSLIGYCNKRHEMILVYEYMTRGTLADHLYKINLEGNHVLLPLSWERRLNICLDAARGLNYLHTGGIIHRDVKSTNILLDENWVAKIADFGLCKTGPASHSCTHISTAVKGTVGYLDPDYYMNRRLTKKSDVFAFGVVMLEIICGRCAFDDTLEEKESHLERWAKPYLEKGLVEDVIDPNLRGRVPRDCLNIFVNVAKECLYSDPSDRPTMADIVADLQNALRKLHQDGDCRTKEAEEVQLAHDDPDHELCSSSPIAQGSVPSTAISLQRVQRRRFSLREVRLATNNFDDALVIGDGGFGKVYKGQIEKGSTTVAIKRLNANSRQGAYQFWTEISTLSKLLHINLVTLIGYCDENREMILVYEYMINGSLADHLHRIKSPISFGQHEAPESSPLSWERRLQICIGAARGLDYLHSGAEHIVIHRDVKSSNILLDENWVTKISDFGLAKMAGNSHNTVNQSSTSILTDVKGTVGYLETDVKGTFGYLDPDYVLTRRLSRKSDVYAFGVVLFEVLCGRPAIDPGAVHEERSLTDWAQHCIKNGRVEDMIDPFIKGKILPQSLKIFVGIARKCLHRRLNERPRMSDVMQKLEFALSSNYKIGWHLTELDEIKELEEAATDTDEVVFGDSGLIDMISKWEGTDAGETSNSDSDDVSESKETTGDGISTTNHLSETSTLYEQPTHGTGSHIQFDLVSAYLTHGNMYKVALPEKQEGSLIPEFPRIFSFSEI